MESKDREREFVEKPKYHGAPLNHTRSYFRGRLEAFREIHPEFDAFLKEVATLLERENNGDLQSILRFVQGDPEPNWVSPKRHSMFALFVKLYNYCLSPSQAVRHILRCLELHKKMLLDPFRIDDVKVKIQRYGYNGQTVKVMNVILEPIFEDDEDGWLYYYEVNIPEKVRFDTVNTIDCGSDLTFEIVSEKEIYEDVLSLFEYHQHGELLKRLYDESVRLLKEKGTIVDEETKEGRLEEVHEFKIDEGAILY